MKFLISVDMEGVAGLPSSFGMKKDDAYYRESLTKEVNSVIDGILKAFKSPKEILVCDSHNEGENILPEKLNAKAALIRGYPRNTYMMTGIDESFDMVFLVGYHASGGTGSAVLDHTFSGKRIQKVEINGRKVGEFDLSAGLAAQFKVPVGFASGDDKLASQIKEVAPWVKCAVTKYSLGRYAAKMIHPSKAREMIKKMAYEACKDIKKMKILRFKYPLRVNVDFSTTAITDVISLIPAVNRTGGRSVSFEAKDFQDLYNLFSVMASLSHTVN